MYQLSFYNYYVNNGDRTIYFNSISGQIFSVSEQENQFLQNQFNDLISFELEYNSMFKKFVDWEFITDTERDQKDVIRLINHKKVFLARVGERMFLSGIHFRCFSCLFFHFQTIFIIGIRLIVHFRQMHVTRGFATALIAHGGIMLPGRVHVRMAQGVRHQINILRFMIESCGIGASQLMVTHALF